MHITSSQISNHFIIHLSLAKIQEIQMMTVIIAQDLTLKYSGTAI